MAEPANCTRCSPSGKAGNLGDLSQRAWAKDVPAAAHDMYFDGAKLYGLPMGLSLVGVVYNTALFQQLGCKCRPPSATWSTCAARSRPLARSHGARRPGAGLYAQAPAANTVYATNPNWNEDRAAGKVTFAGTPGWQAALQEFTDLNNAGCFQQGASADTIVKAFNLLGSDQAVDVPGAVRRQSAESWA